MSAVTMPTLYLYDLAVGPYSRSGIGIRKEKMGTSLLLMAAGSGGRVYSSTRGQGRGIKAQPYLTDFKGYTILLNIYSTFYLYVIFYLWLLSFYFHLFVWFSGSQHAVKLV